MKFSTTELMSMAMDEGERARLHAPPNPWVGALIVNEQGVIVGEGHTQAPGAPVRARTRSSKRAFRVSSLAWSIRIRASRGAASHC
jgi:pyrimidine deaminase RibD-like protein